MPAGDNATCTVTVTNMGPDLAQGVRTVDEMLSNGIFDIVSVDATKGDSPMDPSTCTMTPNSQDGSGTVECDIDLLDAGHSATIEVVITAAATQNINNRVEVFSDSPDPDLSDNVAEDEVNIIEQADLGVVKLCKPDGPALAGENATCEIHVTNYGASNAQDVMVTDTLTANGTFRVVSVTETQGFCNGFGLVTSTPFDINCDLGQINVGNTATVKVTLTADDAVDINNVAVAIAENTEDPNFDNNSDTDGVQFIGQADLSITKFDDTDPVIAGGASFEYDLQVVNHGPSAAHNVVITDQVPAGLTILSAVAPVGSCNVGVAGSSPTVCTFDTIPDGGVRDMTITVEALPDTRGLIINDASVSSDTADPDNSNDLATEDTTVEGQADLEVDKTRTSVEVVAGAEVDYQMTVTNNGPSTATGVELVDVLDPWMTFMSSNPACVENPTGTLTCALGELDPGESTVVFLTVKLDPATPHGTGVNNTATVSGNEVDPVPGNNTDDAPDNVTTKADLWLDKTGNFQAGNPSSTVLYFITVHNEAGCSRNDPVVCGSGGPSDAVNVQVIDTLPVDSKKVIVTFVSEDCTYDESSHMVTCTTPNLPFGAKAVHEIHVQVKGSLGLITNTAAVSSNTPDPDGSNNSDFVDMEVSGGSNTTGGPGGRGRGSRG
jgi:uncharacterized repeat protein (TIGR01451 family)